jgi:hypothetical protein
MKRPCFPRPSRETVDNLCFVLAIWAVWLPYVLWGR